MTEQGGIDLHIPADIVRALRLPTGEVEDELRRDLAVVLYARGALSVGKAAEFAGLTRHGFDELLGRRRVQRQYGEDALAEDLAYGEGGR